VVAKAAAKSVPQTDKAPPAASAVATADDDWTTF
jgi:hypothetical protein